MPQRQQSDDPLLQIVNPVDAQTPVDDPLLSIVNPAQQDVLPGLDIVESAPSDALDSDGRVSMGEAVRQHLLLLRGIDPRSEDAPGIGELLRVGGFGPTMSETQEGTVETGQSFREGLVAPSPFGGGQADPRGVVIAQAIEAAGQVGSGMLEMFTPDEPESSFSFNTARTIREATRTPAEELADEALPYKFTRALTQTGAFVLGSKGLGGTGAGVKMQGAIAAWLGAGVGGQAGAEDARAHGATDDQIFSARMFNQAFGTTEGLPLMVLFQRIDDGTGGFLSRHLKTKTAQYLAGGTLGFLEEGLQEAGQTFGENWTAADLAAYDPGRSLNENILEAAGIGGSVGMMLNLMGTAVGIRNRGQNELYLKENVLDPLGANSLDEIVGPFSLLSDRLTELEQNPEVREQKALLEQSTVVDKGLQVEGMIETERVSQELQGRKKPKGTKEEIQAEERGRHLFSLAPEGRQLLDVETLAEGITTSKKASNRALIAAVMTAPSSEGKRVGELAQEADSRGKPIIALTRYEQESAVPYTQNELHIEKLLKLRKDNPAEFKAMEGEQLLDEAQTKKKGMDATGSAVKSMTKDVDVLLNKMLPLLKNPEARIVVEDHSIDARGETTWGMYGAFYAGEKKNLLNVIALDTKDFVRAAYLHSVAPSEQSLAILNREKAGLLSTIVHEFGHAVAYNLLGKAAHSETASEADTKLLNAVKNDYYKFLRDNLDVSVYEAQAAVRSLATFARAFGGQQAFQEKWPSAIPDIASTYDAAEGKTRLVDSNYTGKTIDYLFSFQEFVADHMAKTALDDPSLVGIESLPFFQEAVAQVEAGLKTAGKFRGQLPSLAGYWKTHSIQQQIENLQQILGDEKIQNPFEAAKIDGLLTQEQKDRLTQEGDTFNRFMDVGFNILQIAEQNPHILGLQNYVQNLRLWKNEVNNNLAIAEGRLSQWKELGKEDNEKLGRILYDETIGRLPDGGWLADPRHFTEEELASYNLSEEALELRQAIKDDFRRSLNQMEEVLVGAKQQIFALDQLTQGQEILKVRRDFDRMRQKPYFPLMRFGDYVMEIRAKGDQVVDGRGYKDGQVIEWQTFDSKGERDKALNVTLRTYAKEKITHSVGHRTMPNFSLQGMPLTMLEHLESKLASHTVNEEVREAINQVKNDILPFKSFRKQFQRRKRVEGYSMDAMRSYANYMTSFSNHIARVKYDSAFKQDFENVENSIKSIRRQEAGDFTKRAKILNHMNEHLDYVMNPVDEFVSVRSAAFLWYLGFNVKSAFVNLTQVPLVTYPYLAARYGDGKAVAELTRANKTAIQAIRHPEKVDSELRDLITRGMSENWLDESLATELAMAASEKNLGKTLPRKMRQKIGFKASYYGSFLFHQAEKFNRHVTAIAAYRLAKAKGLPHERRIEEARKAVEKSQFEYARWARPRFMRGKVGGTVFVFQNYMQNALYFALGGDKGALRMVAMLFLLAGLQGLPLGEDIMDLVDTVMTVLKRKTGTKDPHTQVRTDIREWLNEMDVNADLVMHGLSSSTFGLANLGEYMGWPIPDIDLSGSLSMGRIVPGTDLLPQMTSGDMTSEEAIGKIVTRAGGAIMSAGGGVGHALMNSHPDTWKAWEKAMPAAMRNVNKALRTRASEGEQTRGGYPISEFDHFDPKDVMENYAQMFGFTPHEVSKGWEGYIASQQAVVYYETWRQNALRHWNFAKETKDREGVVEANAAIREYNKIVPYPEMKIGPETRIRSYESYVQSRRMNEQQIEQNRPFRRLSDSVRAVFEDDDS